MDRSLDLTNLRVTVVAGSNAEAITLTGIATEDEIISVIHWTPGATCTTADVTSHITISAADTILPDADYSSDSLIVLWSDKSQGTGYTFEKFNLRVSFCDGHASAQTLTGIATEDKILGALHVSTKADNNTVADFGSKVTISAANTLAYSEDTANDLIILFWVDVSGGSGTTSEKFTLKVNFLDGHATTKALTGVATEDTIVSAWLGSTKANQATIEDFTSSVTISSAGNVAYGADCTNDQVIVFWLDRSI